MSTRRLVDYLVVVGCTETDNLREYRERCTGLGRLEASMESGPFPPKIFGGQSHSKQ